jgi:large subunit ribosomal protein L34e
MPERQERYGKMKKSMKKVRKRTSGRNVLVYRKGRTSPAVCNNCGCEMHGMPRLGNAQMAKLAKSKKRPNRKFGGYLCSKCTKEFLRNVAIGV